MAEINCELCNGACCRWLFLPKGFEPERGGRELLELRGAKKILGVWAVPSPCSKLQDGKCTTYENRPMLCRKFIPGSVACLMCRELEGYNDRGK